jgi:hypothetical protein
LNYKKEQRANIETPEIIFLSVAGYTKKDLIRNVNLGEELSNTILKSRSQWKYHVLRMEDGRITKEM